MTNLLNTKKCIPAGFTALPRSEIDRIRNRGRNVILDIDVMGGINVKNKFGNDALSIFIQPPSIETLRQRLNSRGTDSPEAIDQRVEKAGFEIAQSGKFDRIVVNDNLDVAVRGNRKPDKVVYQRINPSFPHS